MVTQVDYLSICMKAYLGNGSLPKCDKVAHSILILSFLLQDACSSGSGESSEQYNEGVTVSTTIIYNSIFEQQRLGE